MVGHIARELHLVRDDDHGHVLFRKAADDLQHAFRQLGVERRRGLVEEEHRRIEHKGAGDGHALLLPA